MKSKTLLSTLFMFVVFCTVGSAQITLEGLVGYWKFDEGTGTTVGDEVATTNGELINAASTVWTTGYRGTALDFSQATTSASYVKLPGDGVADMDASFTITCWVKCEMPAAGSGTETSIISKGVPYVMAGTEGWYHLSMKDDAVRFMTWDGEDNNSFASPGGALTEPWDADAWYQIVCVRDLAANKLIVYLNGEWLSEVEENMVSSITNTFDFTFGCVAQQGVEVWDTKNYKGLLDEVQLYDVALKAEQVKTIYDAYTNQTSVDNKLSNIQFLSSKIVESKLGIRNASELKKLEVYSLTGQLVRSVNTNSMAIISEDVSDLSLGTYIVRAYRVDNSVVTAKFVKR